MWIKIIDDKPKLGQIILFKPTYKFMTDEIIRHGICILGKDQINFVFRCFLTGDEFSRDRISLWMPSPRLSGK